MADDDKNDVMKYKYIIKNVGEKYEIDPAIICGIISRESRGGRAIRDKNGWGDHGKSFGLMLLQMVATTLQRENGTVRNISNKALKFSLIYSKRSRESFLTGPRSSS
ncbi:unnamed protein product [Coregonus sp. 'balchen']|nr:unnamed protein product [Coregonus sp. 'balchen']